MDEKAGEDAERSVSDLHSPVVYLEEARHVLRNIRKALQVPEAESITEYARLHFARSVVACDIYNIMDSMPEGVGEAFIRDRIMAALAKFPARNAGSVTPVVIDGATYNRVDDARKTLEQRLQELADACSLPDVEPQAEEQA
jgi:hypothetical protein